MAGKTPLRSGRWTLEQTRSGARLTYAPSKSVETITFELSPDEHAAARALARKEDPSGIRDLLLTTSARAQAMQGSGLSALIAANTWRWALPLFGGPKPARRRTSRA